MTESRPSLLCFNIPFILIRGVKLVYKEEIIKMEVMKMKWEEVRKQYPNRCVLVEALDAETHGNKREINEMSVIADFENGIEAWKYYKQIHKEDQSRELYIFHTNNIDITVVEQPYLGIRRRA